MTNQLSPSAQAVLDAAYALPLKNGQPNIAAALRAAAKEVSAREQREYGFFAGVKSAAYGIIVIAQELENHQ